MSSKIKDGVPAMNAVADFLDVPRGDCVSSLVVHPQAAELPYQIVLTSCPKEYRGTDRAKAETTSTVVLIDDLRDDDEGGVVLVNPRRKVAL